MSKSRVLTVHSSRLEDLQDDLNWLFNKRFLPDYVLFKLPPYLDVPAEGDVAHESLFESITAAA